MNLPEQDARKYIDYYGKKVAEEKVKLTIDAMGKSDGIKKRYKQVLKIIRAS